MRGTLRKNCDHPTARENSACALERFSILRGVETAVLPAVDGNRSHRLHEPSDHRHIEQRRFREKRHWPRRQTNEKQRIDQAVRMVDCKNYRTIAWDSFYSRYLDARKENAQDNSEYGSKDTVQHRLTSGQVSLFADRVRFSEPASELIIDVGDFFQTKYVQVIARRERLH